MAASTTTNKTEKAVKKAPLPQKKEEKKVKEMKSPDRVNNQSDDSCNSFDIDFGQARIESSN